MPLPAFAEMGPDQQEDTPLAAVGTATLASGSQLAAQWKTGSDKEITGLGTKGIGNPKFANGGWNKVYFGSEGESGPDAPVE